MQPSPPSQYKLESGQLISSQVSNPDALSSAKRINISLPGWVSAQDTSSTSLWYILPLNLDNKTQRKLAVYLENVSQNAEVFLNKKWLGNGGSMSGNLTRNRNHTLLFDFDKTSHQGKQNILSIHVVGDLSKNTYLGNVYVGPSQIIKQYASMQDHLRVDLVTAVTFAMLLTSIFFSILWLFRQNDSHYLFYAIFTILWTYHDSNHFLRDIPINVITWEILAPLSFGYTMLCVVYFVHRYTGVVARKIEKLALLYVLILSLPFLYHDLEWVIFYAYSIWSPAIAFLGIYTIHFIFKQFLKTKDEQLVTLFIGGISIMIFGMHDLFLATHVIPKHSPYMIHFAVLLVIIVISINLINRFVRSMNVVEHYNQELQLEIKQKTEEMEYSYGMLQQLTKKYSVAEERQRIMRDIHDGIGGQLVATLASIEAGQVNPKLLSTSLKAALQDLRLVIDSLDYEAEDLPTLLGMLRMRLSEQLSNASLKLHWKVENLPRIDHFGPTNVLHTMRIVQEAITNAIKHSNAKNLTVNTDEFVQDNLQYACITIIDDGIGADLNSSSGRGLLNMKKRSDLIGANISFDTHLGKGMSIRLEIPVIQKLGHH
ncbi:sensor histidine kinase [Leucothrix arctica]|nr:ATP-binding protein [Leucothrix arctica]